MSVNRKIKLSWQGKEYSTLITMLDVDNLENEINLALMASRLVTGDTRKSHAAHLISKVLNLAGCQASQSDVFYGLCDEGVDIDFNTLDIIVGEILDACFIKLKKKPPAKKKSQAHTRGKASIS